MKIDTLINRLNVLKSTIGGDKEIVLVSMDGENEVFAFDYPIIGDFVDCDGNKYNCAFIINMCGEEFTKNGIPHYSWKPLSNKL